MKAIIVGGGIGGLTTALCLDHFGVKVEVLEASPELSEIGAGIQLSPNAMKVFEALRLDQELAQISFAPEGIALRMGQSGMTLIETPLGDTAIARWGSPYLHIHRADLISVLQNALQARQPDALQLGAKVTGFSQASALLANGDRAEGSFLIGADGIHSAIRAQMLGPDKPVFTGNVAWRAVIPVETLGAHAPAPMATAWMGRGKHAVTYLLRNGTLANLVAVVERDTWNTESWTEKGSRAEALADFAGWHPTITHMIEHAETLYRWALFDRPPLPRWSENRVAIMGDAAHSMLPFMAQGAAMSIEDAWAIGAKISQNHGNIPAALYAYKTLRKPRATSVQLASRANAKTFHKATALGRLATYGPMWLAGRVAPRVGLQRQDKIYSYNIRDICEREETTIEANKPTKLAKRVP